MWRANIATASLGALNAGLLGLLGLIWYGGERRIREPQSLPVHAMAAPDLHALSATPAPAIDALELRDQAIFYSRRVFYAPPPPSQAVPAPDYLLAGTMDLPQGKRIAFVKRKADQTSRTLHVGDDLDGWRVDSIEAGRVVIACAEQRMDLVAAGTPSAGLLHSGNAPTPVAGLAQTARGQVGIRVLGASGTAAGAAHKPVLTEARTFRPPPHSVSPP